MRKTGSSLSCGWLAVCAALMLAGCSEAELPAENVVADERLEIYKSVGSIQCEPDSGVSIGQVLAQLNQQDIGVYTAACGVMTGMQFITVCGAEDGNIHVFTISESDLGSAQQMGFERTSTLPKAEDNRTWQPVKCPIVVPVPAD